MPLLLALAGATLAYTAAGLVFEWFWGPPVRKDALARELERVTSTAPVRRRPRWSAAIREFALACIPLRPYLLGRQRRARRQLLNLQFRDALYSIAGSLRAGASLPTAVERSVSDLRRILQGQRQQPMVEELERVAAEMQVGGSLEDALVRLRDRVRLEDVTDFVNSALLCQVRGGNLALVMADIAQIIGDKVSVQRQVQVLTAGKRLEAILLTGVPPVLVLVLAATSPDYLAPLFSTLAGQLLALLGVALLVAAYFIGRKIVEIEV